MSAVASIRSWLFVPGDDARKHDKASTSGADALIFDLEDSVTAELLPKARTRVRNFLASRNIKLPEGADGDPVDARSVKGLGNRKNGLVLEVMKRDGVAVFEGATTLVIELRRLGVKVAVVSASENTKAALAAAGILALFDAIVDGFVVKERHLAGKPAPDSFLEGARMLGVEPVRCVVLEDALAGVQAGRSGHFALVIGVDHHDAPGVSDYADELRNHGADVVVTSLTTLGEAS